MEEIITFFSKLKLQLIAETFPLQIHMWTQAKRQAFGTLQATFENFLLTSLRTVTITFAGCLKNHGQRRPH